jgi:hypothetical protein
VKEARAEGVADAGGLRDLAAGGTPTAGLGSPLRETTMPSAPWVVIAGVDHSSSSASDSPVFSRTSPASYSLVNR